MRKLACIILAFCMLCGCGGNGTFSPTVQQPGCTFPTLANSLLGKVWIAQLDCGGTKRTLRLTFTQSGCNLLVNGQALIYNGAPTGLLSFAGTGEGTIDPNTGAFTPVASPVSVNGSQVSFTMSIIAFNPTNNLTTVPQGPLLVVPGTTFDINIQATIGEGGLTGTYSISRTEEGPQQGSICFATETVPTADLAGHWTGTMSGTTNESIGPGTFDVTLEMKGNMVDLAADGAFTDSKTTVKLNAPTGLNGIVIGNQVLLGITYDRSNPTNPSNPFSAQERWLYGTIAGNTITGEFADIDNPTGSGTFTLTRGITAQSRHVTTTAVKKR